jgi:hypothetical protein
VVKVSPKLQDLRNYGPGYLLLIITYQFEFSMKPKMVLFVITLFAMASHAQTAANYDVATTDTGEIGSFGLGFGIDCGLYGGKFTLMPEKHIGVFLGGGILGFNAGCNVRFMPGKNFTPTLFGMYGVNAWTIYSTPDSKLDYKAYNGYSVGLGAEFKVGSKRKNFWTIEILAPFHSADAVNAMKIPFLLSGGFHLTINN